MKRSYMLFPASKYVCNELPQKYLESIFCVFKQLTDNRPLFQNSIFLNGGGFKIFLYNSYIWKGIQISELLQASTPQVQIIYIKFPFAVASGCYRTDVMQSTDYLQGETTSVQEYFFMK